MRRLYRPDDLEGIADTALCQIIHQRFAELATFDDTTFDELAEFWLIEPGDSVDAVESATQLRIVQDWFSDARYPDPDFSPAWEVLEAHRTCYEMIFITNDTGYGIVLWIQKVGTDQTLLAMCAEYAPSVLPTGTHADVDS